MKFVTPLYSATLIKRYKRFLADVLTPDGILLTLHCANTGAMTGCATPGDTVWYSVSTNPKRKYPCSWELTQTQAGHWICVNTLRANQLMAEALQQKKLPQLAAYTTIKSEVRYGDENSRIDFFLQAADLPDCYIEVKSVTLLESTTGYFPDATTLRGQKHLRELTQMVSQEKRAILCFVVLHSGINLVQAASHIDKQYAELLEEAIIAGVEVISYYSMITPTEIVLTNQVPFVSHLRQE